MTQNPPSHLPRPTFRVLDSTPYLLVRYDRTLRLVLFTRRPVPYPDMNTLHWAFDRLMASYATIDRSEHRVLIDTRAAPSRNDEAFESALAVLRPASLGGFSRVFMLVRTIIGKLQISRHAQSDGMDVFVSNDVSALNAELGVGLDESVLADPEAR